MVSIEPIQVFFKICGPEKHKKI